MIDPVALLARDFPVIEHSYTAKDCSLFALGVGVGADPVADPDLRAVYERHEGFAALPAMANVLAYPGFWAMDPETGITWQKVLHGEQSFTLYAPLPTEGTLLGALKITGIFFFFD